MANKEFPVDRWFRRYMKPWHVALFLILTFALMSLVNHFPSWAPFMITACIATVFVVIPVGVGIMIWKLWWEIRNHQNPKFCDKCGHVIQEYEEDNG